MLFNSWEFLALLACTFVLYYLPVGGLIERVWQVGLLLASSAVFYSWENPKLLLLLGVSCLLNAVAVERILFWKNKIRCLGSSEATASPGVSVDEEDGKGESTKDLKHRNTEAPKHAHKARFWLAGTVAANLGLLAFFKYAGFLTGLAPDVLIPVSWKIWFSDIPLPVGISFYTFQGISLVVDTWRRDVSPQALEMLQRRGRERLASIRDLSFYISFFPQLVAGPIVKARDFLDQIGAKPFKDIDWITVRRALIVGYFLKIFVADNLAELTVGLTVRGAQLAGGSPIDLACLLYAYSLQIFADFAGYSLIAIGLGALFGYKLPPNFNFPYLSTSITEFWRRWHLSLSSWLRDYLYFPLGGNRRGRGRTYFNLFLVMFLGGLWHGAAWKFAIWGSLHGLFLALERLFARGRKSEVRSPAVALRAMKGRQGGRRRPPGYGGQAGDRGQETGDGEAMSRAERPFGIWPLVLKTWKWLATFHIVTLLWLTFMMPDMESIMAFFKGIGSIFEGRTGFSGPPIFALMFYGSSVFLYHLWGWMREHRTHSAQRLARSPLEGLLHGVMVFLVVTNPGAPRGFIYFQF